VFKYVHFRHFGELKMRFLLNQTYHKRLCVLKDFGCICVGIRKFYETHLTPNIIFAKKLIFKNCFYI